MKNMLNMARLNLSIAKCRLQAALGNRRGEGFVDSAVKILIAIVIGALLLAGLYFTFNTIILPTLNERIKSMFSYSGNVAQ